MCQSSKFYVREEKLINNYLFFENLDMSDIKTYLENIATSTLQKCVAAVAFAVVKLKPENVSIHEFCQELRKQYQNDSYTQTIDTNQDNPSKQLQNKDALNAVLEDSYDVFSASQPINEETTEIFNNFKNTFNHNESQQTSGKVVTEFEVLQAVENIKNIISLITRNHSDGIQTQDSYQQHSSQDSGYKSSQNTENYRVKKADMMILDRSLSTLTIFLNNISIKTLNRTIVEHVSKEFGAALDILYMKNIYLSFYDNVVDILDEILKSFQSLLQQKKTEELENILLKFTLLNESYLLIHHSLAQLTDELQVLIDKLLFGCGPSEAVEFCEPDMIDSLFYVFHVFEILLKKRNSKVLQVSTNMDLSQTLRNSKTILTQADEEVVKNRGVLEEEELKEKYTKLLSRIILECSESYPLVAFWAMECHNINIQKKTNNTQ